MAGRRRLDQVRVRDRVSAGVVAGSHRWFARVRRVDARLVPAASLRLWWSRSRGPLALREEPGRR